MAQSRKRLFVISIRMDVCPYEELARNVCQLVTKVLPHAFDMPEDDNNRARESIQEICEYNTDVMNSLGKSPTLPSSSKDPFRPFLSSGGLITEIWEWRELGTRRGHKVCPGGLSG